jgi:hypothetical protein
MIAEVTAGWLTTKAIASSIIDTPAASATSASRSTLRACPGSPARSGRVLDYETDLEDVGEAYAAMDERRAIESLVRVGTL